MAIGACGYQWVGIIACGDIWRPMDSNGWLLVLVDNNG